MDVTWHILFIGIALFQMLFMAIQWLIFKRKEYLYYIAYIMCVIVYIVCRIHDVVGLFHFKFPNWLNEMLDQPMIILAYAMYNRFSIQFLNISKLQPNVFKYGKYLESAFISFILVKLLILPFNINNGFSATIYVSMVFIMLGIAVPMIYLMLKQRNILNNFLVLGCLFFTIGGISGMLFAYFTQSFSNGNLMVFMGVEIGVLLELLLLNTGFALKNKFLHHQVLREQENILQKNLKEESNEND